MNQELINIILIIGIAYISLQLFDQCSISEAFQNQNCNTEEFMKRWSTYIKSINNNRFLPIDSNLTNMIFQIRQSGCIDSIIAEIEKVKKGTGQYIKFIIENTQFGYTPQGFEDVDEIGSFLSKWNTYLYSLITNDSLNPFTDNVFASLISEIRGLANKDKLFEALNAQYIKKTPGKPDIALGDVIRTIIDKTTIGVTGQVPQVVAQQAAEENVAVLTPQSQYALQQGRDSQSVETQISQQPMVLDAGTLTQINQTGQVPQMPQQARQLGLEPENPVYSNVPNTQIYQTPQQVYQTPQLTTQRGDAQTQVPQRGTLPTLSGAQMFQNTENTFTIPEAEVGIVGASNIIIENGYYTEKSIKRDFDLQYLKPLLTEQYKEKPFGVIEGGLYEQANF